MKKCLLLGRKGTVVNDVAKATNLSGIELFEGTSIEDVRQILKAHKIDAVIMGAGLDIQARLEIIQYIFDNSRSTTVHMKDWDSGPAGMLPFVTNILNSL